MSNPVPSAVALTTIADGSPRIAAPVRNNYSALQTAINALIAILADGTNGQKLQTDGAGNLSWATETLQKVAYVGYPSSSSAAVWPSANAAILVPFTLQQQQTIDRVHFYKGAVSGNFDVGIYDASGNRKVSKGSTAQSTLTVNAINEVTFTSTVLTAGQYYLAVSADNTTGAFGLLASTELGAKYQLQVATAFPLPATLTPGTTHPASGIALSAPAT